MAFTAVEESFRRWLQDARGGCVLCVHAPLGSGTSTFLRGELAKDWEVITVASGMPKLKVFLVDVASSRVSVAFRRKILLLDPIDAILTDQVAATELGEFAKGPRGAVPIIITGFKQRTSASRIKEMFRGKTLATMTIPRLTLEDAANTLHRDFPRLPRNTVEDAFRQANGDMRAARLALENNSGTKDIAYDGADALDTILNTQQSFQEALTLHEGDPSMVSMGIFENYTLTYPSLGVCEWVTDAYSRADILDEATYGKQRWELAPYYIALAAACATKLPAPPKKIVFEKFGSLWSKTNNLRSKTKLLHKLCTSRATRGLSALGVEDLAYVRNILSSQISHGMYGDVHMPPEDVLTVMRLWKARYTLAEHAKLKAHHAVDSP